MVFEEVLPPEGKSGIDDDLLNSSLSRFMSIAIDSVADVAPKRSDCKHQPVLLIPPDFTRFHSQAGKICCSLDGILGSNTAPNHKVTDVLPALGTHAPMTPSQISTMFPGMDPALFRVHDWRNDVKTVGHAPASLVEKASRGIISKPWPAQLNNMVLSERHGLIVSVGQVVPHEVTGMANYNKNLFVGVGGVDAINLSHFIGAVYGMERMMGRADNPLREILEYASVEFLGGLPLFYVLTVMGKGEDGELEMKGLFFGNDRSCFDAACSLSIKHNFTMLPRMPTKVVVNLPASEFHSTWLGNKAIYRLRMAVADGGEVLILAPGVSRFGEDDACDDLIRRIGYCGTDRVMEMMRESDELRENLSVVAHLIHGSTEGRFQVTYCAPKLTRAEVEAANYNYGDLDEVLAKYPNLVDGWNDVGGEEVFYVSNPALGLWAHPSRFEDGEGGGGGGGGGGKVDVGGGGQKAPDGPTGGSGGVGGSQA